MKDEYLDTLQGPTLHTNMDILKVGLDTYYIFELKGNLTDSTVCNTGEAGDINRWFSRRLSYQP